MATLQDSGTKFVACDLPEANELVIHILAAVAQAERKAISARTKAALSAAKDRGVRLGNPNLPPGSKKSAKAARDARSARANKRANDLKEIIEFASHKGLITLRDIAGHLNSIGINAPNGGKWHAGSVRRVRQRIGAGTKP